MTSSCAMPHGMTQELILFYAYEEATYCTGTDPAAPYVCLGTEEADGRLSQRTLSAAHQR